MTRQNPIVSRLSEWQSRLYGCWMRQKVRKRMKEVELVIKTPEKIYESVMDGTYCGTLYQELKNGTPLPKGHGRLIDADYKVSSDGRTIDAVCGYMAPTIIEADKAESEG